MGATDDVYQATDTQTGQTVAIKRLKPALVQRNPQMLERFRREGEALRQLDHPNTVKMLDTGEHAGSHYIVMEYVDGGDLHTLLTSPLAINEALTIAIQIADALTRTHFLDILHRDIKPANVLIASGGTPKLTDLGRLVDEVKTDLLRCILVVAFCELLPRPDEGILRLDILPEVVFFQFGPKAVDKAIAAGQ